jgi:glycosyltransferase involved in cell wall biosynthesis
MFQTKTGQMQGSTKICFVALGAYPLLSGKSSERIIGPDIHQIILAKELIKQNFKVTFITQDKACKTVEYINGMEIIKIRENDYPVILKQILKLFYIANAMRKAKACIYIHAGGVAGAVSPFCKLIGRKFVYDIGSDALVDRNLITQKIKEFNRAKFSLNAIGNWLDIKFADAIIVQSEFQKKLLKKNFGKDGIIIKLPFHLTEREAFEKVKPPIVLWVGSIAEVKQPELFEQLAEALPEAKFQMIGGSDNQEFYCKIKKLSKRISNFEFLGVVPFLEVNEYFGRAAILVNTSVLEGFPHAFIQAWMNYTPIVSLNCDPDGIISKYKMGFHSKSFEQLVEDIKMLLNDEQLREEMGRNGRHYVEREHDITKIIRNHIEVFNRL